MSFILPFLGLVAGFIAAYRLGYSVQFGYANYLAVAVLATLDSLVGGWRAGIEHRFDKDIFLSGFFMNAIAAGLLAYFGDVIGVQLSMVATIVFGYRIFNNLSLIRTHWIASRRSPARNPTAGEQEQAVDGLGANTTRRVA